MIIGILSIIFLTIKILGKLLWFFHTTDAIYRTAITLPRHIHFKILTLMTEDNHFTIPRFKHLRKVISPKNKSLPRREALETNTSLQSAASNDTDRKFTPRPKVTPLQIKRNILHSTSSAPTSTTLNNLHAYDFATTSCTDSYAYEYEEEEMYQMI